MNDDVCHPDNVEDENKMDAIQLYKAAEYYLDDVSGGADTDDKPLPEEKDARANIADVPLPFYLS